MALKTILNYTPNFNSKKRISKEIKFIIFHYTGMKKESEAIKKLTNIQSEVSSHYIVKNNGELVKLLPDLYIAWHAGKSSWKNYKSLNSNSIGIEITNPGHEFNYKNFSKKQIMSIIKFSIPILIFFSFLFALSSTSVRRGNQVDGLPRHLKYLAGEI